MNKNNKKLNLDIKEILQLQHFKEIKQRMEKEAVQSTSKNNKTQTEFDLTQVLIAINQQINQTSQEDVCLYKKLVSDLNINNRQKLKHYKKVLQSGQKENLVREKWFINKYLKKAFLQQYLVGNTESKPALINLLKRLEIISYQDLIKSAQGIEMNEFQEIKCWSEIVDLINRQYKQTISKQEFDKISPVIQKLQNLVLEGSLIIKSNEYKAKWLGTFTEVLRTQNLLIRVFNKFVKQQIKNKLVLACRIMIEMAGCLSKEVVTQLHLLLVFLNPNQPEPSSQNYVCLIHYYHAISVVKGQINITQLISLIPKIKQTQHKCQLLPILEQAFMQHYHKLTSQQYKEFKNNVFDQVINLFQVGRSIYSYLQTIVKIIIEAGDHWNMEGNFVRKFFISTIVLKILPTQSVIKQWPSIIEDIIVQCGNMSVPYALDCAKILLQKLYQENNKNYQKWSLLWIDSYKNKLLDSNEKGSIRGIIQFINPILLKICPNPFLLKYLLDLNKNHSNSNLQLGVISLIRCYKEIGQIEVNQKDQIFQHILDKNITFSFDKIRNFLLSNDEMIAFQALELVSCSLKPSQFVKPMQMKLCLQFYRNSMKTSMPEYRKNYLALTKKLFERLRNIYDGPLTTKIQQKKPSKKLYYTQFVDFLKQLVSVCFTSVFPEAIFQLVNPALEVLSLLQHYFGNKKIEVKKGIFLEPTQVLKLTSFYDFKNFENLLACLQSSYQSVRKLAHDLLNFFDDIQKKELLLDLWEKSLQNTNKLAIRSYEYACRILTYISDVYPDIIEMEQKYQSTQLNVLNFFLKLTRERYQIFKEQFIKQGSNYYNNLVHGLLTIFSFQIQKLARNVTNTELYQTKYSAVSKQIKEFLDEFFIQIINMLNFAVEISSSNVSTVVLDTLTQGSQTDKRLKVDCRGHFLHQTVQKGSNVGTFLESTALISSMQDDEQGIQNTLVVSFYLLTREAGLVFQSIGELLATEHSSDYIPSQNLIKLINTYFYALVNLKHMGSVDRISKGLGKMARVIFDHQSKQLSQLPEILLNKLLSHLKSGNFTNILRRSAGVPFAFCCLLKSESLKRNKLIEKSVTELLNLSRENKQNPIELRIHALNILKKLFQDSDLKSDLDPYVSDAFISSIKGFSSEQWGVRNSSLMLFTALSNRTVGVRPTYNLLEFFIKCPNLLQFIQNQLHSFTQASLNTMYPPLYPIVLLFSRLLPFDLKEKSKAYPEGNMKNIRKQELLRLLPILDRAGLNHNYMGRVMTAKAILPFMQIDEIVDYCVKGILTLPQHFNKDNNKLHYELTKYYHLLTSYKQICKNSLRTIQISNVTLQKFIIFLDENINSINSLNCPVVLECFIKIIHYFFETFNSQLNKNFSEKFSSIIEEIIGMLTNITEKYVFETQRFVIHGDLGHSMMRKQAVSLHLDILIKFTDKFEQFKNLAIKFTQFLNKKLELNENFFQTSDNQICEFYFQKILQNIKILKEEQKTQLFTSLTHMLSKLQLDKIRSDIILSKVLELRWSIGFKSLKNVQQTEFLLNLEKESNNHFLKISIFKYLDSVKVNESELMKLLINFSDPNSLQQLRQCSVEYLQTLPEFNPKLNIIYIRLLEDEEYEIRKETARITARHLKIYQFNETVIKNDILRSLQLSDIEKLLLINSDFKIKRKNHEEERIFSYDKPNKFRSDITTLFELLLSNQKVLKSQKQISQIFRSSLSESQIQTNVVEVYEKNIVSRSQYQFELVLRKLLSEIDSIEINSENVTKISDFHCLFTQLIQRIKSIRTQSK